MTEIDILKDIALKLNKIGIDYMISGSVAMNFYATPRMTRDVDIIILLTSGDMAHASWSDRLIDGDNKRQMILIKKSGKFSMK